MEGRQARVRQTAAGWEATQARYDRETRHNQIRVAQNRWLEKIENLLTQ